MPQRLNAHDFYYKYIAPEENYKNYQEFYQKDIWQEQLQMTQNALEVIIHRPQSWLFKIGEQLVKGLHFTLLRSDWTREHEDFRHSYVLDLENVESKSRIIQKYLRQR